MLLVPNLNPSLIANSNVQCPLKLNQFTKAYGVKLSIK
jgi:hypothetical protein